MCMGMCMGMCLRVCLPRAVFVFQTYGARLFWTTTLEDVPCYVDVSMEWRIDLEFDAVGLRDCMSLLA